MNQETQYLTNRSTERKMKGGITKKKKKNS